jgi:hypothetical protein
MLSFLHISASPSMSFILSMALKIFFMNDSCFLGVGVVSHTNKEQSTFVWDVLTGMHTFQMEFDPESVSIIGLSLFTFVHFDDF